MSDEQMSKFPALILLVMVVILIMEVVVVDWLSMVILVLV